MRIVHIYNNNVVLAQSDSGEQAVVLGRGLAFGAKKGQEIDPAKIEQTFTPQSADDDHVSALLSEIPSEVLQVATELEIYAKEQLGLKVAHSMVLPLADHLNYALSRARDGVQVDYPLSIEVTQLYPREFSFGRYALQLVKERFDVALPEEEATPFALHLVNTQFSNEDLSKIYRMTEVFAQIFNVIAFAYGHPLDQTHMSVARFVTHLRYLFVRAEQGKTVAGGDLAAPAIREAVRTCYPKAYECANRVKMLLELHLNVDLSADEHTYLTIHVARLAKDLWDEASA